MKTKYYCNNKNLTTFLISRILSNIIILDCSNNSLQSLPKFINLSTLVCYNNILKKLHLPKMMPNINHLDCYNKKLDV